MPSSKGPSQPQDQTQSNVILLALSHLLCLGQAAWTEDKK